MPPATEAGAWSIGFRTGEARPAAADARGAPGHRTTCRRKDPKNLANIVGYDEPIDLPDMVRAAFLHGATLSPEELERRRRRQRHHTVSVYLLHACSSKEENAYMRSTKRRSGGSRPVRPVCSARTVRTPLSPQTES